MTPETPIGLMCVPVRVYHALLNMGCATVADVLAHTRRDFLELRNFGKVSLRELEEELANHGLELKSTKPPCCPTCGQRLPRPS